MKQRIRAQAAEIDAGVVDKHHVQVKVIHGTQPGTCRRVVGEARPLVVGLLQLKRPIELVGREIEGQQAVKSGRRQENTSRLCADFVAMPEMFVPVPILEWEFL